MVRLAPATAIAAALVAFSAAAALAQVNLAQVNLAQVNLVQVNVASQPNVDVAPDVPALPTPQVRPPAVTPDPDTGRARRRPTWRSRRPSRRGST